MAAPEDKLTFMPGEPERVISTRTWVIAALAVLLLLGMAAIATMRRGPQSTGAVRSPDAYSVNLPISGITMAEATNGAGGKSTYVDGAIRNTGSRTLVGALVQVTFATTDGSAPYRETVPLELIRTREPYVDLQPVSAAPLSPGQEREFRLIFETLPESWDVKAPQMQIVHTDLK